MTATLDDIHRDPTILDRAIERGLPLEIMSEGKVTARFIPRDATAEPDFLERAKRIWGDNPPGIPLSEVLRAERD